MKNELKQRHRKPRLWTPLLTIFPFYHHQRILLKIMRRKIHRFNYKNAYTYSLCIFCTEFHVAQMHNKSYSWKGYAVKHNYVILYLHRALNKVIQSANQHMHTVSFLFIKTYLKFLKTLLHVSVIRPSSGSL